MIIKTIIKHYQILNDLQIKESLPFMGGTDYGYEIIFNDGTIFSYRKAINDIVCKKISNTNTLNPYIFIYKYDLNKVERCTYWINDYFIIVMFELENSRNSRIEVVNRRTRKYKTINFKKI